jgi:hypothetical protein
MSRRDSVGLIVASDAAHRLPQYCLKRQTAEQQEKERRFSHSQMLLMDKLSHGYFVVFTLAKVYNIIEINKKNLVVCPFLCTFADKYRLIVVTRRLPSGKKSFFRALLLQNIERASVEVPV